MTSRKWHCYSKTALCSVKGLAFVIVNEAIPSGSCAVIPTIAA